MVLSWGQDCAGEWSGSLARARDDCRHGTDAMAGRRLPELAPTSLMEVLVCSMSLNQECAMSGVRKAVAFIMLPFLQNSEVIRAAWTEAEM